MARRLDDYRVGEYRSSVLMNFIQTIIVMCGIVALFLLPFPYGIERPVETTGNNISSMNVTITVWESPVTILRNANFSEFRSLLAIIFVVYITYLLINLLVSLLLVNVGRSIYIKISKVIELLLGAVCLSLINYYVSTINGNVNVDVLGVGNLIVWQSLIILEMFVSLISYYKIKKVSIYD